MVDWWTEEDGKEYESRVEVMVEQANKFEVFGQTVKVGTQTNQSMTLNAQTLTDVSPLLCICYSIPGQIDLGRKYRGFRFVIVLFLGMGLCILPTRTSLCLCACVWCHVS